MPREEKKNRPIVIVTYPGVALFDLVATKTVLDSLAMGTRHRSVTLGEHTEPMDSNTPMRIIPEKRFEEVPDPFAIIVPGGGANALEAMGNERLLNYLRFAEHGAELVSSVSTGALILAAAGLLEGRQATTHWAFYKILENLGAEYVRKRWVEDRKFIFSAGVSAGIDMALALAARLTDEETAQRVQRSLGYDPHPPFGGIDYDRLDAISGTIRAGVSLAAPAIAAKPKRLTRRGR